LPAISRRGLRLEDSRARLSPAAEEEDLRALVRVVGLVELGVVEELDVVPEHIGLGIGQNLREAVEEKEILRREPEQLRRILRGVSGM
jgi:hypothetical protein